MYFHCALILALSLFENEASERYRYPERSDPGRAFQSPKLKQGFDTAAELAKLIKRVHKEAGDEKVRSQFQSIEEPVSSHEDETNLETLFKAIQKKIDDNEGIRIHVIKNTDVLDKYKKELDSRAVVINNPEVLKKYVAQLRRQKMENKKKVPVLENLLLQRRNAVFRLDEPEESSENQFTFHTILPKETNLNYEESKDFVKPTLEKSMHKRKRYDGPIPEVISKRFNKVSNKNKEKDMGMSKGKKKRDPMDQSREIKKELKSGYKDIGENLGYKNEREDRGYKNDRGSKKREFKDYPENFDSPDNPNHSRTKTTKDYDYDKPRKPKKSVSMDYQDDYGSKKKKKNIDKFDDYDRDKKKGDSWGQSMASERKKPIAKMSWNDKPKRKENNERRRPRKEEDWGASRGSNDYNARSSKNEGYGFGNTPIPFNLPRNIYVNENGE